MNTDGKKESKKYWLKLQKDFLKSSQVKVIKDMPNGKNYLIFYLALMLESIETYGHLRFSDLVPYNENMLASITDTNIDIVRTAIKLFTELGLIQFLEDGTIFLTQIPTMVGNESGSAERVREYRKRLKITQEEEKLALQCNDEVTKSNDIKRKKEEEDKKENKKEDYLEEEVEEETLDYDLLQKNLGRPITPIEYQKLEYWLKDFNKDMIMFAIGEAVSNNARTMSYIEAIFRNWKAKGFKTLGEIEEEKNKYHNRYNNNREDTGEYKEIFDYNWLEDTDED